MVDSLRQVATLILRFRRTWYTASSITDTTGFADVPSHLRLRHRLRRRPRPPRRRLRRLRPLLRLRHRHHRRPPPSPPDLCWQLGFQRTNAFEYTAPAIQQCTSAQVQANPISYADAAAYVRRVYGEVGVVIEVAASIPVPASYQLVTSGQRDCAALGAGWRDPDAAECEAYQTGGGGNAYFTFAGPRRICQYRGASTPRGGRTCVATHVTAPARVAPTGAVATSTTTSTAAVNGAWTRDLNADCVCYCWYPGNMPGDSHSQLSRTTHAAAHPEHGRRSEYVPCAVGILPRRRALLRSSPAPGVD